MKLRRRKNDLIGGMSALSGKIDAAQECPRVQKRVVLPPLLGETGVRKADGRTIGRVSQVPPLSTAEKAMQSTTSSLIGLGGVQRAPAGQLSLESTPSALSGMDTAMSQIGRAVHSAVAVAEREFDEAASAAIDLVGGAAAAVEGMGSLVVERATALDVTSRKFATGCEPHAGYPETCLFIRKLKTGMHFVEHFGKGRKRHISLGLSADNQYVRWHVGPTVVSYSLADLIAVDELNSGESFVRAARARPSEGRDSSGCWFTLVFKKAAGKQSARANSSKSSVTPVSTDGAASIFVELSADSEADCSYTCHGMELLRLHHRNHSETHSSIGRPVQHLIWMLEKLHHLYRPHYSSNHPLHAGTLALFVRYPFLNM